MIETVHKWKLDANGKPERKTFSEKVWNLLLNVADPEGNLHKKGGWVKLNGADLYGSIPPPLKDTSTSAKTPSEDSAEAELNEYGYTQEAWEALSPQKRGGIARKHRLAQEAKQQAE